jgi:hypothetical protein
MSTCPPNLRCSFLTICKIIMFKVTKTFFFPAPKGDSRVLKAKKTIFQSRYGMCLSIFLFLIELGTCPQNLIPAKGVEHWEKNHFPQGGMLKFTYKDRFWTIKIAYEKFLDWKSERWKHVLVPPLHVQICIFEKILKSRFLVEFQSFIFGQILANLGSFGQIFASLTVADSMPQLGWNLKNLITFEP